MRPQEDIVLVPKNRLLEGSAAVMALAALVSAIEIATRTEIGARVLHKILPIAAAQDTDQKTPTVKKPEGPAAGGEEKKEEKDVAGSEFEHLPHVTKWTFLVQAIALSKEGKEVPMKFSAEFTMGENGYTHFAVIFGEKKFEGEIGLYSFHADKEALRTMPQAVEAALEELKLAHRFKDFPKGLVIGDPQLETLPPNAVPRVKIVTEWDGEIAAINWIYPSPKKGKVFFLIGRDFYIEIDGDIEEIIADEEKARRVFIRGYKAWEKPKVTPDQLYHVRFIDPGPKLITKITRFPAKPAEKSSTAAPTLK